MINRRQFTLTLSASALTLSACGTNKPAAPPKLESKMRDINWANLTDADWKDRLTAGEYDVLRHEGTERPWTSSLNDEKREGVYVCKGCDLPLFKSSQKFDSGTGWPSFFDVIDPKAIGTKTDRKLFMARTEYHCSRCGGHQGHVFNDGPAPTGLRYCNNGVAIRFVPS